MSLSTLNFELQSRKISNKLELKKSSLILILLIITILSVSCGGGGGGSDDFVGAADVAIDAQPTSIDPGNQMRVYVDISHPNSRGILVKVKFPRALKYVNRTSLLVVDDQDDPVIVDPTYYETVSDGRFLVYLLHYAVFSGSDHARLHFDLEALSQAKDKLIEVDADVDTKKSFDSSKPLFEAQDQVAIEVID